MEYFEDGTVVPDGVDTIMFTDGTSVSLPYGEYEHFRHDHMCEDGPLWFIAKKRARDGHPSGSVWYNTDHIKWIDMSFNSKEVADVIGAERMALEMSRMKEETEASIIGTAPDGTTVYADEIPSPVPIIMSFSQLAAWMQSQIEGGPDGTILGPDGN